MTTAALPDRYFVLGHPVAHSQSPFIHNAFAQQTGQHLVYDRRLCALDGFEAAVRTLAADRDGGRVGGCNVTMPFKFEAARLAAHVSARAALAEAANVLRFDEGGWTADNTDGIGLMRDLEGRLGLRLAGQRVLLIGAGGAAAGVLGPLLERRPAAVLVVNRSLARADTLVARHRAMAQAAGSELACDTLDGASTGLGAAPFSLVINASASSVAGGPPPVSPAVLGEGSWAIDLMYGQAAAPFLAWARAHGAQADDGLGMLVEQAAEAFWLWRDVRPQTAPVLAALRARLESPA